MTCMPLLWQSLGRVIAALYAFVLDEFRVCAARPYLSRVSQAVLARCAQRAPARRSFAQPGEIEMLTATRAGQGHGVYLDGERCPSSGQGLGMRRSVR